MPQRPVIYPEWQPASDMPNAKGLIDIPEAAEAMTIETTFTSLPGQIHAEVVVPAGAPKFAAFVRKDSITSTSFIVDFDGKPTRSGYQLAWLALYD